MAKPEFNKPNGFKKSFSDRGGRGGGFKKDFRGGGRGGGGDRSFNKSGDRGGFVNKKGGDRGGFNRSGGDRSFNKSGDRSFGDRGGFRGGSRGGSRGGRGGGKFGGGNRGGPGKGAPNRSGMPGGKNVLVEPHQRLPGVFVARGKEDALVTRNLIPGDSVYGEKRISVETDGSKIEYRIWNPFRSKLGAAILSGIENIYMKPGSKVLYLGAASGTTVSHCSDIVGEEGRVYAVEFSQRSGRDLLTVAQKRNNIVPIIEDARHPQKYRAVMSMVDCIFSDVAQPDQARILALNAHQYLKPKGHVVIAIKANCIDSTAPAEAVFAGEIKKLKEENIKPLEQASLEPYERDHACVVGIYRPDSTD